jgi:hypothetical protein
MQHGTLFLLWLIIGENIQLRTQRMEKCTTETNVAFTNERRGKTNGEGNFFARFYWLKAKRGTQKQQ